MPRISRLDRRSFLGRVLGTAAAGGAIALIAGRAKAQSSQIYTGVTDADTGPYADRPGYGVGTRTQYTDQDTGPNRDAQFHGRGPQGATSGSGSYGTAPSGCSDTDGGEGADPGGRGVRCNGQTPPTHYPPAITRHCTDSDGGNSADPVGQGRNC